MKKVTNYEISLKTHQFKQSIHTKNWKHVA